MKSSFPWVEHVNPALRAIAGLTLTIISATAQGADFKLAGSCLVLDYDVNFPADRQSVTSYAWSGACDAGGFATGPGELRAYWDGRLNEDTHGTMTGGRLKGRATTTNPLGYRFVGDYQGGQREGHGVFTGHSTTGVAFRYTGGFHLGKPEGYGTEIFANGKYYAGGFRAGAHHGEGIETGSNSEGLRYRYEGEFMLGEWSGHGTLTWSTGDRYVGEFLHGKCDGQGTWTWPDGERYKGRFAGGRPNGFGKTTQPDGSQGEGIFLNGKAVDSLVTVLDNKRP